MCADCGCGCKKGKPEKGCKCECKTCAGARKGDKHESSESKSYESKEKEVEKFLSEASEILKAYTNKQLERKRNIGLDVATGGFGAGFAADQIKRASDNKFSVHRKIALNTVSSKQLEHHAGKAMKYAKISGGAKKMAVGASIIGIGGLAQAGKAQVRLSHRKSKMDVSKSAFFAEDVEKAFNPGAIMGQLKSAGSALKTGFKSGKMFGGAGVKNAVSPFGAANATQKVKTAGFKAGNAFGAGKKYAMANPGKTAAMGAGAGAAGYGATKIKKSDNVSAFGVEH
jgi:hypothetical protein